MEYSDSKKNITAHALQAFLEGDYTRVSVREIASRSGYSHTHLHTLYKGKRGLFKAALHHARQQMIAAANLLPDDTEQMVMMKILSINPLEQPAIQLIRKSAANLEMREAIREMWDGLEDGNELLAHFLTPLMKKVGGRHQFGNVQLTTESLIVLGFSLIWATSSAELLIPILGVEDKETQRRFRSAPQELIFAFITMMGNISKEQE